MGVPVVATVARRGEGREALSQVAEQIAGNPAAGAPLTISYGSDVDPVLDEMERMIVVKQFLTDEYPARWTALKYLESDRQIHAIGLQTNATLSGELESRCQRLSRHLKATMNVYPQEIIADQRYGFIRSLLIQNVISAKKDQNRLFLSDRIDNVLTNRFAGPVILAAVPYGLYQLTFSYSELPVGWLESFFGWLGGMVDGALPEGLVKSLIISGVIDGVGGVLGFVPLIMFMFLGIAVLEDSGYLARIAFMLDRVFRSFGLHGASVMAFIVSGGIAGGCAVTGVMATRTLRSPK